jgi:RimJ/RimL family protein N-acetyltransferase
MGPAPTPPFSTQVLLRDGTSIEIRALMPADRDQLSALVSRMSLASLHHRFCCGKRELTKDELVYLSSPDGVDHVALAAVDSGRVIGIGRYIRIDHDSAEIAFDVADADQGRGIGTLLLEQLARIASCVGVKIFRALVESDNTRMLDVFEHSGLVITESLDVGVYEFELTTASTEQSDLASARRKREADARHGPHGAA